MTTEHEVSPDLQAPSPRIPRLGAAASGLVALLLVGGMFVIPFLGLLIAPLGSLPVLHFQSGGAPGHRAWGPVVVLLLVAAMAGNPRGARQVVRVLNTQSDKHKLPWHRVINAQGTISLPKGRGYELQKSLLETEGIEARAHVYIGNPDDEIEKAARDCQASMIVLGSSAKNAWVEKWLGSTPRKIAEKSVYPTLLIPPEKA